MAKELMLPAATPTNYFTAGILIGSVVVVIAAKRQQRERTVIEVNVLLALLLFLVGTYILPQPKNRRKEIGIVIFPLGLQQVTRDEHGHDLSVNRFWPASDILDCIVMERVLVHTVRNIVCLRVRNQSETSSLVEAFPGAMHNSYEKCLELRAQILGALDRRTKCI